MPLCDRRGPLDRGVAKHLVDLRRRRPGMGTGQGALESFIRVKEFIERSLARFFDMRLRSLY